MNRQFLILLLTLFPFLGHAQFRESVPYADLYDSEMVRNLKENVAVLSSASMEGRRAGSDGEAAAADYVAEKLSLYGVDLITPVTGNEFGISRGADTLVSRNVLGFIQGSDPALNGRYIVVGARLDGAGTDSLTVDGEIVRRIRYGANGNASGLSMLIELGRMLSTGHLQLRRSVLLVAFGASSETLAGSWYFLNRCFPDVDRIDAMVCLDALGLGYAGFYAYTSSNADMSALVDSMQQELLPVYPSLTAQEPFSSDHRAFYAREIPSVLLTTGAFRESGTEKDTPSIIDYDSMEKEAEYVYAFVTHLSGAPAPSFLPGSPKEARTNSAAVSYFDTDVRPSFLASTDPSVFLTKWVYQYLKYPKYAVENGIQGRVRVDFVVDEAGNVTDVEIGRGVHESLDEEAVRVISASPKWRPGRVRGKKVRTAMSVTVEFKLEKKGKFGFNGRTF